MSRARADRVRWVHATPGAGWDGLPVEGGGGGGRARGHEVTCAARGTSGSVPEGARLVEVDRTQPLPDLGEFDAVVDVARHPSWVRNAVAAYADAHWVFVSTINVYADDATPGGTPATLPLRRGDRGGRRPQGGPGGVRPDEGGLRADRARRRRLGDGDPARADRRTRRTRPAGSATGRRRLAAGGEVLAPGDPADVMQVADVRDLAAWAVTACEQRTTGVYDGDRTGHAHVRPARAVRRGRLVGRHVDLGRPGVPAGAGGRAVDGSRCDPAVAPPPGVRRPAGPRRTALARRRAHHPPARRDHPRHARLARGHPRRGGQRHLARPRARAAGRLADGV